MPSPSPKPLTSIALLALALLVVGCSGFGTSMSKVQRMGQNKGYEIKAPLATVQRVSMEMLTARGYSVSIMPDRENGAGGAGRIVIGQRVDRYQVGAGGNAGAQAGGDQRDIRELINVFLSKKWQLSSDEAVPNLTLVELAGSSFRRKETGGPEEETPASEEFKVELRNEIERRAAVGAKGL